MNRVLPAVAMPPHDRCGNNFQTSKSPPYTVTSFGEHVGVAELIRVERVLFWW
jgi:hypothetical protein